jgi:hypothetical protein
MLSEFFSFEQGRRLLVDLDDPVRAQEPAKQAGLGSRVSEQHPKALEVLQDE